MVSSSKQMDPGGFSEGELDHIHGAVQEKYREVSNTAEGKFKYITGKSGAIFLGYDREILKTIDAECMSSFCGVGNVFALGEIKPESTVLDIGCGAGFDAIVASKQVGAKGRICGIDLTEEMVQRSRNNIEKTGITNIEIQHVSSEKIPYDDCSFDIVISNGVINLSPCKSQLFQEIYRVLKPGGKFQFADIILDKELPSSLDGSLEAWTQ